MRPIDRILSKSRASTSEPAVEARSNENRFAPRRSASLPALIHVDNSEATIPCLVRDMSATGARLELRENWYSRFAAPPDVNDHIRLVLRLDGVMYHCKVMRRAETELGVKFETAPAPVTAEPVVKKSQQSHTLRKKPS